MPQSLHDAAAAGDGGPPARLDADIDTSARGTAVTVAQSSR